MLFCLSEESHRSLTRCVICYGQKKKARKKERKKKRKKERKKEKKRKKERRGQEKERHCQQYSIRIHRFAVVPFSSSPSPSPSSSFSSSSSSSSSSSVIFFILFILSLTVSLTCVCCIRRAFGVPVHVPVDAIIGLVQFVLAVDLLELAQSEAAAVVRLTGHLPALVLNALRVLSALQHAASPVLVAQRDVICRLLMQVCLVHST